MIDYISIARRYFAENPFDSASTEAILLWAEWRGLFSVDDLHWDLMEAVLATTLEFETRRYWLRPADVQPPGPPARQQPGQKLG